MNGATASSQAVGAGVSPAPGYSQFDPAVQGGSALVLLHVLSQWVRLLYSQTALRAGTDEGVRPYTSLAVPAGGVVEHGESEEEEEEEDRRGYD